MESLGCVLEQDTLILALSTGSTQEDPSRYNRKIVDWDVKKITNKASGSNQGSDEPVQLQRQARKLKFRL